MRLSEEITQVIIKEDSNTDIIDAKLRIGEGQPNTLFVVVWYY
jgi:hypothetical protein